MHSIKCWIVGQYGIGKTSCLISYTTNTFPGEYNPTVYDNYATNVMVDKEPISLSLWDGSHGGWDMDRLRPLGYPQTDVFMIAFSIISHESLAAVREKWSPELKQHMPKVPVLLVGMKGDLRNDEETIDQLAKKGKEMVTVEEAQKCAKEIGAKGYYECSALTQDGLKPLFDDVIRAARVKQRAEPKKKKKECTIL